MTPTQASLYGKHRIEIHPIQTTAFIAKVYKNDKLLFETNPTSDRNTAHNEAVRIIDND
jgi:hypothetical protein